MVRQLLVERAEQWFKSMQEAGVKPLDEVRQEVEQKVARQMDHLFRARWLARLRRNAYVKYFENSGGQFMHSSAMLIVFFMRSMRLCFSCLFGAWMPCHGSSLLYR